MNALLELTAHLLRRLLLFFGFVALLALATGLIPGQSPPAPG